MDIKEVGHTIQIAGAVFNSYKDGKSYIIMVPGEKYLGGIDVRYFDTDKWKEFLWQSDIAEVEINTSEGKVIVRKASRQINSNISWRVYQRDNYACRYCGKTGIPLTVDHVVLWEEGGPSLEENLVASCKKCNQTRGNMQYADWINSSLYKKISKYLPQIIKQKNLELINKIKDIPISFTKMRGKSR